MKYSRQPVAALVHFIHRRLLWVIVASYFAAAALPVFGLRLRTVELGSIPLPHGRLDVSPLQLMLAMLLFNAGLGLRVAELGHVWRAPRLMVGGLVGNVLTPLAFIVAVSFALGLWHNPEEAQQILVGLALVAAMPVAGASTAWAQNANGNLALSLGLVLFTTLLSPLLTPLVLHMVGFVTHGDYAEDLHTLAAEGAMDFLGLWVILPALLGMAVGWLLGEGRPAPAQPYLKLVNYAVLVLLNYSNASLTLPKALFQPDWDFLVIMLIIVAGLCLTTFAAGYGLARLLGADRGGTVALMFGLGMNNNGTGLVLASMALAHHPEVLLPIIFYNLIQHLVASLVYTTLPRWRPA